MLGLLGVAVFAFGVWLWRSERVPAGALRFSGTVVDVRERRSTTNQRMRYGPVVAYQHPVTGSNGVLEPAAYTNREPSKGTTVAVAYDRDRDRVLLVPDRPLALKFVVPAVGAALAIAQAVSWAS